MTWHALTVRRGGQFALFLWPLNRPYRSSVTKVGGEKKKACIHERREATEPLQKVVRRRLHTLRFRSSGCSPSRARFTRACKWRKSGRSTGSLCQQAILVVPHEQQELVRAKAVGRSARSHTIRSIKIRTLLLLHEGRYFGQPRPGSSYPHVEQGGHSSRPTAAELLRTQGAQASARRSWPPNGCFSQREMHLHYTHRNDCSSGPVEEAAADSLQKDRCRKRASYASIQIILQVVQYLRIHPGLRWRTLGKTARISSEKVKCSQNVSATHATGLQAQPSNHLASQQQRHGSKALRDRTLGKSARGNVEPRGALHSGDKSAYPSRPLWKPPTTL